MKTKMLSVSFCALSMLGFAATGCDGQTVDGQSTFEGDTNPLETAGLVNLVVTANNTTKGVPIKGDSQLVRYVGGIDAFRFENNAVKPGGNSCGTFVFTKVWDTASIPLYNAYSAGDKVSAKFQFLKTGGKTAILSDEMDLVDAVVTAVDRTWAPLDPKADGTMYQLETVTFSKPRTVTINKTTVKADGTVGGTNSTTLTCQ